MNKNTIVITVVSVVAMFGFLFGAYMLISKPEVTEFPELQTVKNDDHVRWSPEKKSILIEYSDFQCPACAQYHTEILKKLEKDKEVMQKISLVYRNFPLDSIHLNARKAAFAAEAASMQGKFWEMHDLLFENQIDWSEKSNPEEVFISYAKKLKLKEEQFKTDMNSKQVQDKVQNDFISGTKVDVQGTPTFFLNGKKLSVPGSVPEFKQIVLEGTQ